MNKWLQDLLDNQTDIATSIRDERLANAPTSKFVEPKTATQRTPNKWDELNLTQQTRAVQALQDKFDSSGRRMSAQAVVDIARWGYTPDRLEIDNFIRNETDFESLKPAPTAAVRAVDTVDTGFNLTLACRAANADEEARERVVRAAVEEGANRYPLPKRTGTSWLH